MTANDSWRRYLEAGTAVGQVTLARAEEITRGLLASDEDERAKAWRELDDLTRLGRHLGGQFVNMARAEMSKQLETLGVGSLDQFLKQIADLVRSQPVDAPSHPPEASPVSEHPERASGAREPDTARTAGAPARPKTKEAEAKKSKKDKKKGPKGSRTGPKVAKGHKKEHKKKEKKKEVPERPHWAFRVLTLARSPDFAGSA